MADLRVMTVSPSRHENQIVLVLGGARSGKSAYAESLLEACEGQLLYLATAKAFDNEMENRIEKHQKRRSDRWVTVETPLKLAQAIEENSRADQAILVDCLTLWVTNLMMDECQNFDAEFARLTETLRQAQGSVVLVSNEVGMSIVPENKMARDFRDHAGLLHQKIAAVADRLVLVCAGIPMIIKG